MNHLEQLACQGQPQDTIAAYRTHAATICSLCKQRVIHNGAGIRAARATIAGVVPPPDAIRFHH